MPKQLRPDSTTPAVPGPDSPWWADLAAPAPKSTPPKPGLVRAVWCGPEPVMNPLQGLICPGWEIWVSEEQLADPNTPASSKE